MAKRERVYVALGSNMGDRAAHLAYARDRLAPYKRVRRIEFAELPKTISGKIRRVELRADEAAKVDRDERPEHSYDEADFREG